MNPSYDTTSARPGANRQEAGPAQPRRRERGRGREEHHHGHASDARAIRFAFAFALFSVVSVAILQWFGEPAKPKAMSPVFSSDIFFLFSSFHFLTPCSLLPFSPT